MSKAEIRMAMQGFLNAMPPKERHARSLAACRLLIETKEFRKSSVIMIFLSMATEIETAALAIKAWGEGKSVIVPRVDWGTNRLEPVEITSLDLGMRTTARGLKEPVEGRVVPLDMIEMVVIPGLAFDCQGFRVGRGRGFYDRFLAQQDFAGIRCGLCFSEQLLTESTPCEPHDAPMDLIVTDQSVVRCARSRK